MESTRDISSKLSLWPRVSSEMAVGTQTFKAAHNWNM